MFHNATIPFDSKMLFNVVKLKEGVSIDELEQRLGILCNIVKNKYGNEEGGFLAGQVFKYAGFISDEGSCGTVESEEDHVVIQTFWKSFEKHEESHADDDFKRYFSDVLKLCDSAWEKGYDLLWQDSILDH